MQTQNQSAPEGAGAPENKAPAFMNFEIHDLEEAYTHFQDELEALGGKIVDDGADTREGVYGKVSESWVKIKINGKVVILGIIENLWDGSNKLLINIVG